MFSFRQLTIYGMVFASGTLIGYDSGYLNGVLGSSDFIHRYGAEDSTGWYLTPKIRALFTSLLVVGTLSGSISANFLFKWMGRKGTLIISAIIYGAGVALQVPAPPAGVFVLGRILLGMGLGLISVTSPMYLVESSRPTTRGRFIALYTQLLTCGNVIVCGISLGTRNLAGANSWRVTVGFQLFLALVIFLGALIAPESPVILMKANKHDEARQALASLRNIDPNSEEMTESIDEIARWVQEQSTSGEVHLSECFKGPDLRRQLLGICIAFFTIATGITFWFGYGTTFFEAAGVNNSYLISLILALVNAVFTAPSPYLVERFGRRICLFVGGVIMAITMLVPSIIHQVAPGSRVDQFALVAGAVIFIAAYAPSWGTIGWIVMTEPYSQRLRLLQSTITMVVYWTSTWAVGFITPYMVDATAGDLGVKVCYVWLVMIILSVLWAYFYVPELAGLSVAETDLLFETGIPARKSASWGASLRSNARDIEESTSIVLTVGEKGVKTDEAPYAHT
ncbi:sugar porter family MFS transporter [Aspergillus luchuensis]|uniref:Uncharacterized protein n=1 Tax=Aspergillus kawachii TaxID=1069201 RepID=A0A7R7WQ84_ASPKA|nr:uncharacterized protein AKAW2_11597S [Aspergillus luchuensis]BCR94551.1 hypothetical protein AKAW2_11597S [Aspergillus luchuensis]BCS07146.1 hypothetical protein ALUC_11527S [Aspergillus luchuensis]GAA85316.1 glucose transporter [Aspergillus luchuensis IFO 4308]